MEYTIDDDQKADLAEYRALRDHTVKYAEVEIASADILTMFTTPVEVVPAAPSGQVIEFISAVCILDHGGTDYTTQGDLTIQTGTTGTALSDTIAGAALLLLAADGVRVVQALSADAQLDPGESLVIAVGTGNPAAGDGVLRVKTAYRIHDTGL